MSRDERFDIVIVGGGPNGMTTAAYLAKCGLRVCVLEERTECGGACETQEPIPGVRIYPHAMLMYASPAPGFEQLELHKYGFRMEWDPMNPLEANAGGLACTDGWRFPSDKDKMGWAKLGGLLGSPPFTRELMRAAFWCPPHPPEVEVSDENTPYMQVYKKYQPEIWTPELREMTMFDLMDEHLETEHFKTAMAFAAWASGAAGHWEGVAIPAALCVQLLILPNTGKNSIPRGGLHGYFHAIHRAAVHRGAVIRTNCPVEEILIDDGRAVGVRLRETAACGGKTIRAEKAVIAACDVHQAFLQMVGPKHLDPGFIRKVKDISLKNQTLYVSVFHTKRQLTYKEKFREIGESRYVGANRQPGLGIYPCDSREIYYENVADVDGRKGQPTVPPERALWFQTPPQSFDPTDCQGSYPHLQRIRDGRHLARLPQGGRGRPERIQAGDGRLHARGLQPDGGRAGRRQRDPPLERHRPRRRVSQYGADRRHLVRQPPRRGSAVDQPADAGARPLSHSHRRALSRPSDLRASGRALPDGDSLQPDAHPHRGRSRRAR